MSTLSVHLHHHYRQRLAGVSGLLGRQNSRPKGHMVHQPPLARHEAPPPQSGATHRHQPSLMTMKTVTTMKMKMLADVAVEIHQTAVQNQHADRPQEPKGWMTGEEAQHQVEQ